MASTNFNGSNWMTGVVLGSLQGARLGLDLTGDSYIQATATALAPLARYKTRGLYAGATETWTDRFAPTTPAPSTHVTTETGHTKSVG